MFCEKCGTKLPEGSIFCMNCGSKAITGEAVQETAVSADTVMEAEPAAVEKETMEIPEVQPIYGQAQGGTTAEAPQTKPIQPAVAQSFKSPAAVKDQPPVSFQSPVSFQPAATDLKPEKIKPLQTWKFVGMLIVTAIPVINLIMVLIWSFSGGFNKNTRSYARATLILWIAGLVLMIITAILNWALIQYIWSSLSSMPAGLGTVN